LLTLGASAGGVKYGFGILLPQPGISPRGIPTALQKNRHTPYHERFLHEPEDTL